MSSVIRIKRDGSGPADLSPCSVVPAESVIARLAKESGELHYESTDGRMTVGVWECTPYAEILSSPNESEFCVVLEGKVALTNPDGSVEQFSAGQSYVVPRGFVGRFEVLETLRKIYVIHNEPDA